MSTLEKPPGVLGPGATERPCLSDECAPAPAKTAAPTHNEIQPGTIKVSQPVFTPTANGGGQATVSGEGGVQTGTSNDATKTQDATPSTAPNVAATTNTPLTASSSGGGSNLSSGAVAGVAIAALIVGALLAFVAAFFFFKRRNKTRNGAVGYNNYTDSTPELVMMQKSAGRNSPYVQVSQTPLPAPAPAPAPVPIQQQANKPSDAIASVLPVAAHDNEVQGRVAALIKQIHRHVETFYRDVHASITPSMEPELVRFGAKDVSMAELLQDCSSPTTALKHALVAYVLGITGPKQEEDDGETLFPDELGCTRLYNSITSDPKRATAQALHRRLSVYLHASAHTSARRSWSFQSDIREAAEHFSLTFFPWASPTADDQEKEDDLTRIIAEALETRIWLFGQPCEYVFRWDGVGTRGVVISPELVAQEGGEGLRARVVLESGIAGL